MLRRAAAAATARPRMLLPSVSLQRSYHILQPLTLRAGNLLCAPTASSIRTITAIASKGHSASCGPARPSPPPAAAAVAMQPRRELHATTAAQSRLPALFVRQTRRRAAEQDARDLRLAHRIWKRRHRRQFALRRRYDRTAALGALGGGGGSASTAPPKIESPFRGERALARLADPRVAPAQVRRMRQRRDRARLRSLVGSSALLGLPGHKKKLAVGAGLLTGVPPAKVKPFLAGEAALPGTGFGSEVAAVPLRGRRPAGAAAAAAAAGGSDAAAVAAGPLPIVPHDLRATFEGNRAALEAAMQAERAAAEAAADAAAGIVRVQDGAAPRASLRDRTTAADPLLAGHGEATGAATAAAAAGGERRGLLSIPAVELARLEQSAAAPAAVHGTGEVAEDGTNVPLPSRAGPAAFAHGVTAADVARVVVDGAAALGSELEETLPDAREQFGLGVRGAAAPGELRQRGELVRRVVTLENASASEVNRWNRARVVELFGRKPFDTGSPEVQVAVLTVKMDAMRRHLERNRKDSATKRALQAVQSQRMKMLKYLRRKNLERFVETCRALGIEPDVVMA
ncbi:ribosomal protein S15 [Cladochytrium tenue]|nr:ribosomal protein S15 [Cladochytrium tenue]